jgi:hypothetical protein
LKQQILVDGCSSEVTVNKAESIITRVDNVQCSSQQKYRVRRGGNTKRLLVDVASCACFVWMISSAILCGAYMGISAGICDCKTNIALSWIW